MHDLPARAERAGVDVTRLDTEDLDGVAPFDLILCDAPCSGSGAWRRSPDGKWRLDQARLSELCQIQASILDTASQMVSVGGALAYATCSVLSAENSEQAEQFISRKSDWTLAFQQQWTMQNGADGFYAAHLTRDESGT